jgi:hypothetical protein
MIAKRRKTRKETSMKTSTKFATLAFGAASLIALVVAPASAQTVGGANCSTFREMDKKEQCLTRATDNMNDKEGDLKRDGVKTTTYSGSGINRDGHSYHANHYSDGSEDYRNTDPKTGITTYKVYNSKGTLSTFTTRPGVGGSGGKRSAN